MFFFSAMTDKINQCRKDITIRNNKWVPIKSHLLIIAASCGRPPRQLKDGFRLENTLVITADRTSASRSSDACIGGSNKNREKYSCTDQHHF
jgi:hypothetical protein